MMGKMAITEIQLLLTYMHLPSAWAQLASQFPFWISIAMYVITIHIGESLETTYEQNGGLRLTAKARDIPYRHRNGCGYE